MSFPFRTTLTDVFYIDPTQLNESADCWVKKLPDGRRRVRCVGQHCLIREGVGLERNRNNRRYRAEKTWSRHTMAEAAFAQRVKARRVIGQVEHPTDGRSSMGAAAIVIAKVEPPRPSDGKVFIEFETMHTPGGKIIEGFIDSNVGFGISSRGNGSVIKAADGVDEVQEDFEPVTFDCVADESTPGAEVAARLIRESLDALVAEAGSLDEAVRRDRKTAAKALEEMARCLDEGGDVVTCCASGVEEAKTSKAAQEFISKEMSKIKKDHPEWPQAQRVAVALSKAREAGFKVPKKPDESNHPGHGVRFVTEAGNYRAYDNGLGQLDLWTEPQVGEPSMVEAGFPDVAAAQQAAMAAAAAAIAAAAEQGTADGPPAAHGGEWLLGTKSGTGHYRMFDSGPASYSVWFYGHNTQPVLVADNLRTAKDAKGAAETHLHTVIGEAAMDENAQVKATLPFEGTCVCLRFDTPEEHKKAKSTLEKAGFRVAAKDEREVEVTTEYADATAAVSHIRRVLTAAGIEVADTYEESVAEGGAPHSPLIPSTLSANYDGGYGEEDMDYGHYEEEGDEMSYLDYEDTGYYPEAYGVSGRPMVGDPETMPDDLEAKHDLSPEYGGDDPEDLDLDLDVNEQRRRRMARVGEDYETGAQRKTAVVKSSGASAATTDAGAPQRKNTDLKTGGSPEAEKKGGAGEIRPDQRKPKTGGSELPQRGKGGRGGTSEPQKPAKVVEQIITRALPDLYEAWRQGDGKRAARISRFIEQATRTALREMSAAGKVQRVRHLQNEVARLENENIRLRTLTEAMAEVQREEILEYERRLVLKDHPELEPMAHRLKRCDTVQEMQEEAKALLSYAEAQRGPTDVPPPADESITPPVDESTEPEADPVPGTAPVPRFRLDEARKENGTAVSSAGIEGAPTTPLSEATVAPGMGLVTQRSAGDTASRLAAHRRRRRRRG